MGSSEKGEILLKHFSYCDFMKLVCEIIREHFLLKILQDFDTSHEKIYKNYEYFSENHFYNILHDIRGILITLDVLSLLDNISKDFPRFFLMI